jgi:epoxyqueuosine reductase
MHSTNEKLKSFLSQSNIPVFGIAESSHLERAPSGYRPSDLLASPESILCLGLPVPAGIFKYGEKSEWMYWRAANVYYRNIDSVLMQAASIIEEKGDIAMPVFGCYPFDIKGRGDFWGYLSLVKMAEAAGIGKVGKNGLIFNAKYGPRLLLGGIVTTASLPPMSFPERDEKGCPEGCSICQDQCPAKAIDKSGQINRLACIKYSMRSPIFSYFMRLGETRNEDVQLINHVTAVDDHSWYRCIKCVSSCPYM